MLNDEIMAHMLSNIHAKSSLSDSGKGIIKPDISEKEAMQIFNEIIEIYKEHNISYQCACRISIALNEAMLSGAVELYNRENP